MGNVGVKTETPTKALDVNGEVRIRQVVNDNSLEKFAVLDSYGNIKGRTMRHIFPIKTIESNYSILFDDHTIKINNSGVFTLTLPDATTYEGIIFNLKWLGTTSNITTITTTNNQTIDGASVLVLSTSLKFARLQSDGTNWIILN